LSGLTNQPSLLLQIVPQDKAIKIIARRKEDPALRQLSDPMHEGNVFLVLPPSQH